MRLPPNEWIRLCAGSMSPKPGPALLGRLLDWAADIREAVPSHQLTDDLARAVGARLTKSPTLPELLAAVLAQQQAAPLPELPATPQASAGDRMLRLHLRYVDEWKAKGKSMEATLSLLRAMTSNHHGLYEAVYRAGYPEAFAAEAAEAEARAAERARIGARQISTLVRTTKPPPPPRGPLLRVEPPPPKPLPKAAYVPRDKLTPGLVPQHLMRSKREGTG